jgi:tetratricopeptide (TPR) repeat protein
MPASDVQDCADLLRHDASNGAAWRGLAFRFAPSDADALPNPAIVIAASVGDGRSLRAVANWLAARHARRQSGTIGRLLAEAARRDPALVGDYAEWLVSWPNLGRAALVEIGDHLDTTANSAGPLAHFERGLLHETGNSDAVLADALHEFLLAANGSAPGSQLRRLALQRSSTLTQVLGYDRAADLGTSTSAASPNDDAQVSANSAPALWKPDLRDVDLNGDVAVYRVALEATRILAEHLGGDADLLALSSGLGMALARLDTTASDEAAYHRLTDIRQQLDHLLKVDPDDAQTFQFRDEVLGRLAVLDREPCRATAIVRWQSHKDWSARHKAPAHGSINMVEADTAAAHCASGAGDATQAEEASAAAAKELSRADLPRKPVDLPHALLVTHELWALGHTPEALNAIIRQHVGLEMRVGNAGEDLDPELADRFLNEQAWLAGLLGQEVELPAPAESFKDLGYHFQSVGKRLATSGRRDDAIRVYRDAITIRRWLTTRLSRDDIADNLPVWDQIAYAYNWMPSSLSELTRRGSVR